MNKAKIILSVLALFAVVGGVLAFKVKAPELNVWKTTTAYFNEEGLAYYTNVPFCTSTAVIPTLQDGVLTTLFRSTTTPTSTRIVTTVGGQITITVPSCTTSFTTRTTLFE